MKTYGIRYMGSKRTLVDYILNTTENLPTPVKTAIDVFTGTTRVAQAFRSHGIQTHTSDLSWASTAYAYAFIHNKDNRYLQPYVDELNSLTPQEGWITKNYCDTVGEDGGIIRVWKRKNGMRADAIRERIKEWDDAKEFGEEWEKMTLLTSLIFGLDVIDNTVGLQQAYLKEWCDRSDKDLFLKLPPMVWNPDTEDEPPIGLHFEGDALKIPYPTADLAYLDPPYSPSSYSTYYHIWDSITKWDKPPVGLKTNRRADRIAKTPIETLPSSHLGIERVQH